MIRNIVFDMGQVLIHWTPALLIAHFHLTPEEETLLTREVFGNTEWVRLDHGTITEADAAEAICRRLPEKLHEPARTLVFDWWKRPLVPVEGMEELIRELKDLGYGIYLLSNASLRLREYFHRIPGSAYFDGLMVSAEQRIIKPQHAVFYRLLEDFSLNAGECFFIDDSPANVEGAMCVGISGTVFHGDVSRLRRELREAGIPCKP